MSVVGDSRMTVRRFLPQIASFVVVLGIVAAVLVYRDRVAALGNYGYLGVFLISVVSSASIVVPVPGWIIIATLGTVLNPLAVGVISALGGTVGEITGYMLGYSGRVAVERYPVYERMEHWMKRWGWLTIMGMASIPNPLFDVAATAAGALRYPLWKFCIFGALGRIPKHVAFAYAGYAGLKFLFGFLQLPL